jgi:hypothetical protein
MSTSPNSVTEEDLQSLHHCLEMEVQMDWESEQGSRFVFPGSSGKQ